MRSAVIAQGHTDDLKTAIHSLPLFSGSLLGARYCVLYAISILYAASSQSRRKGGVTVTPFCR